MSETPVLFCHYHHTQLVGTVDVCTCGATVALFHCGSRQPRSGRPCPVKLYAEHGVNGEGMLVSKREEDEHYQLHLVG